MTRALRRLALGLRLRLLLALLLVSAAGCRGQAPRDATGALDAARASYNLGCSALEVGDAAYVAWIDGIDAPTDADIATGEKLLAAIRTARAALIRAHDALEAGQDALQDVREALGALRVVSSLLSSQAPPGLAKALTEAERLIGTDAR